jgi:hypothetical protein
MIRFLAGFALVGGLLVLGFIYLPRPVQQVQLVAAPTPTPDARTTTGISLAMGIAPVTP